MLTILGTIFSGILSGGATGLLGLLLQRFFDHKKQQGELELVRLNLENARQLRQIELDAETKRSERAAESAEALAQIDARAREVEAASRDFGASMAGDRASYLAPEAQQRSAFAVVMMALVDFTRGIIRPGVTVYCMVILTMLLLWVQDLYRRSGVVVTLAEAKAIADQVIQTTGYITTTVVVWWFGARPAPKR